MTIEQAETPTNEDPRERLRAWIHAVDMRVAMAKVSLREGKASLGILVQTEGPNPKGTVTAQFDAEPFLDDLRTLVDTDNLWDPETNTRLNLYLVSFNIGPSGYGHADRVLVAALDETHAEEIALGDEDEDVATIKDVTHLGQTPKGSTLEPGILMAEHDSVT
jgi:hypothetical protein